MISTWKIDTIDYESYSYLKERCFEPNWDDGKKCFHVDTDCIITNEYTDDRGKDHRLISWSKNDILQQFRMSFGKLLDKYPQILAYKYNFDEYMLIAPMDDGLQQLLDYCNSFLSLQDLAEET